MVKEFLDEVSVGDVIKINDNTYIICREKVLPSPTVKDTCDSCFYLRYGRCIKPFDTSCIGTYRPDGKSVIFQRLYNGNGLLLVKDIEVLERLSKEYTSKTLENVLMQLQARFKELNK